MDGYFPWMDYSDDVLSEDQIFTNPEVNPSLVQPLEADSSHVGFGPSGGFRVTDRPLLSFPDGLAAFLRDSGQFE